jgi:L-fucose mutarotase
VLKIILITAAQRMCFMNGGSMLKGIPSIISPELLKVLCEMGHGDNIVIADGNFPVCSVGRNAVIVRADGHGVPELLDAILQLFPLDTYGDEPVKLMEVVPGDDVKTPIWDEYAKIIEKYDRRGSRAIGHIERFKYYEEAKKAYCIIATGEKALYANIMLRKAPVV